MGTIKELPPLSSNAPVWSPTVKQPRSGFPGFHESWYLKVNDPTSQLGIWLQFNILVSANGFKRVAEVSAVSFQRQANREVTKHALKQTLDLAAFEPIGSAQGSLGGSDRGVRIGPCELTDNFSRGLLQSKGKTIKWDFKFRKREGSIFNLIPSRLTDWGLAKNQVLTLAEDLEITGTTEIEGETHTWTSSPGMQGHLAGRKAARSWIWGHCSSFSDERGHAVPFVFEGLSVKAKLAGPIHSPNMSSFFFLYKGQEHRFNSIWDMIHCRSEHGLNEWKFRAERGELAIVGHAKAEYRDLAGITYEDTDGSLLYSSTTTLSDLTILVYRKQKLEATLKAGGNATLGIVNRQKNPYVPLLV